jgi:hypothetical protein
MKKISGKMLSFGKYAEVFLQKKQFELSKITDLMVTDNGPTL